MGGSLGKPGPGFQGPLPEVTQDAQNSPTRSSDSPREVLLQTKHPVAFWGALHIGSLCLVYKKVPDFQKESRYLA